MEETRRRFLMALAAAASCSVVAESTVFAQQRKDNPFPTPPASAETQNPAEAAANADPQSARRAALKQDEKEFRAGVSRLYQLAGELKQEVDKTLTTEVFSVKMYKKTEEIEKVAKMLKGKAKG
jgi:hypothetical protein